MRGGLGIEGDSCGRRDRVQLATVGHRSRPLTTRLTITCSSWLGSAWTHRAGASPSRNRRSTSSPTRRSSTLASAFDDRVETERSQLHDLLACKRERLTRQVRATFGCRADRLELLVSGLRSRSRFREVDTDARITVSRLLKSWATPPASLPTDSSFCDCRSCCSLVRSARRAHARPSAPATKRWSATTPGRSVSSACWSASESMRRS